MPDQDLVKSIFETIIDRSYEQSLIRISESYDKSSYKYDYLYRSYSIENEDRILFATNVANVIAAITEYHSYLGVSIDINNYKSLLQCNKNKRFSFNHFIRNLINKNLEIRDSLICSYPNMEWSPYSLQRDGKNALILKIIAELLWNNAPEKIIENLISHIRHIRQNAKLFGRIPKMNFYHNAKMHYDKRSTVCLSNYTPEDFVTCILQYNGFLSVNDLDAIGILRFTSCNYIKDLCNIASKSYNIRSFLYINNLSNIYCEIRDKARKYSRLEYDVICMHWDTKICINPYSILLSKEISKNDKMMWLQKQVESLEIFGKKSSSFKYEALKWFHELNISLSIKSIIAFSIGKFEGKSNTVDIRNDLIIAKIAGFLGLKQKKTLVKR